MDGVTKAGETLTGDSGDRVDGLTSDEKADTAEASHNIEINMETKFFIIFIVLI